MASLNFEQFKQKFSGNKNFIISTTFAADTLTPIATYLKLRGLGDYPFFLESIKEAKFRERYSIITLLPDKIWKFENSKNYLTTNNKEEVIENKNPLSFLRNLLNQNIIEDFDNLPPMAAGWFGYFGYDMVKYTDNIAIQNNNNETADALYVRPQAIVIFDNVYEKITISFPIWTDEISDEKECFKSKQAILDNIITALKQNIEDAEIAENNDKPEFKSLTSKEEYEDMVKKSVEYIKAGDIFQIVPSRRFIADFNKDPFSFYRSLRSINPSPFLFFLDLKDYTITGSSPEIMVRVKDDKVTIRPLAGTRKRGKDEAEDKKLAEDLLNDKKELAEHLMLLDLGRNDVGRVCKKGSVSVEKQMFVEYYSHVMHISSIVTGELDTDKHDCLDALIAGFPAGTVSGAPKIRAMQILAELEKINRGFYAGSIGYFSSNPKHMDMAIMLRTALLKDNKIYLQAGAGVVYDSNPESEYYETENKAKALIKAALET